MERKEFELQPGVILSKLDIKDGDTIIIAIDTDIFDFDEASDICKMVSKIFPNNHVIATFKGIDISADTGSIPK